MGKPRMIILIRHAQSEGNKNREIHQTIPDHRVNLTPEGHRQALEAGTRLRTLLRPDDTIHFFTSPYRRTRETTEGILQSLTTDTPSPSPFPRHTIKVYEEPRLREQDFGNFQPCSAEMERMWLERADYGHFFYRIPSGESAADAYDRISGFNESLWRLFGEMDFASVCVLVTHGLMTRVFLMKWYHWSVEYFEDLRNINHCEFVIMKLNEDSGKYVLQNQLRTWSELKREKELERQGERTAKGLEPANPTSPEAHVPIRRKWGGCPDGCNHGLHRKASLRLSRAYGGDRDQPRHSHDITGTNQEKHTTDPSTSSTTETNTNSESQILTAPEPAIGDLPGDKIPLTSLPSPNHDPSTSEQPKPLPQQERTNSPISKRPNLSHFHRDSEDHLLHPPQLHSNYALIHLVGRDGGGTLSGANSLAPSEDEHEQYHHRHHGQKHNENTNPNTNTRAGIKRHKPAPSQDLDDDGDDEGSGRQTPKLRRTRFSQSHNHNHNHHDIHHHHHHHKHGHGQNQVPSPTGRKVTSVRKGVNENDVSVEQDSHFADENGNECCGNDKYENGADLEKAREEDQSIRGSVY